jgi:hypothetical protein
MFSSFADKPTDSLNKYVCEEYFKDIFANYKSLKNTAAVGLVGHASGLQRHLELYKHFKTIYIIERDYKTFVALRTALLKINAKNVFLINGDFFKELTKLVDKKVNIGLLDFDGVEGVGKNERALYALAKKARVPIVINIGPTRCQYNSFKTWCKENKKRRTTDACKKKRYELKRLALDYCNSIFKGYKNDFFTYMGRSNMYTFLSIQRGLK